MAGTDDAPPCSGKKKQRLGQCHGRCFVELRRWLIEQHQCCARDQCTGNASALSGFRTAVVRCWREWLSRRNRERTMTWDIFNRLLARYPLPAARAVHSVYTSVKR